MISTWIPKAKAAGIAVRPFVPDDLLLLSLRDEERMLWEGTDLVSMGEDKALFPAYTLWDDAMPLACYGMLFPWATVGILWMLVTAVAAPRRWCLWPHIRQAWHTALDEYPALMRVEALTVADDTAGERLLRHLGFRHLCVKRCYGPKSLTYTEWEWLRHE